MFSGKQPPSPELTDSVVQNATISQRENIMEFINGLQATNHPIASTEAQTPSDLENQTNTQPQSLPEDTKPPITTSTDRKHPWAFEWRSKNEGNFKTRATLHDLPNQSTAKRLLHTLALISQPYMIRHKHTVNILSELDPTDTKLGTNISLDPITSPRNTNEIRIRLRYRKDQHEFLPLDLLLAILCHEIAHIEQFQHTHEFYMTWHQAMNEMELNLGQKMRIRRTGLGGDAVHEEMLRWVQWRGGESERGIGNMKISEDERAVQEAWRWECELGWFRGRIGDDGERNEGGREG